MKDNETNGLQANVDMLEVSRHIERAVQLNRSIKENTKELDELKMYLRDVASSGVFARTETGSVQMRALESELCATVSFGKDTPAIIKGVDTSQLAALSQAQFDLLFCRVVKMQPTDVFETAFEALPKKVQNIVKRVVAWVPNTPSVNLSK